MADSEGEEQKSALRRYLPLIILVALIGAAWASGVMDYLSLQAVADNRDALVGFVESQYVWALTTFAVAYIVMVALSAPGGAVLTILGGFLFGPLIGGAVTVVAATIGATAVFMIARTSLGDALAKRAGPFLEKMRDGFNENAMSYLLFLRLVPVFPFWLVNLAPAFLGVPLSTYFIGTLVGIIPGTFAFSFVGGGLDSIIAAQREAFDACVAEQGAANCEFALDASAIITPELLGAFVLLGFVALIPVAVKKFRKPKDQAA